MLSTASFVNYAVAFLAKLGPLLTAFEEFPDFGLHSYFCGN